MVGMDWHRFVLEQNIDPQLAPDWHGLVGIGTDRQIGKLLSEREIGTGLALNWHRLDQIGTDW